MTKRQFILTAIGAVLFAFVLREWHILVSVLPDHTQGDVASYLRYALHMAWDGVFSQAGNGEPVVPDAYRNPGYPVFLLGVLKLSGLQAWYSAVYHAQAVIGALTVGGVIALARQWLPYHWALLAGALFSLWPHHIAATNAMLIEVVFGFVIVIALLLATVALSRRSLVWCVAAGAATCVPHDAPATTARRAISIVVGGCDTLGRRRASSPDGHSHPQQSRPLAT